MKRTLTACLYCLGLIGLLQAQTRPVSIHEQEAAHYRQLGISSEDWQAINEWKMADYAKNMSNCTLNKRVFGWHPYWSNGLESQYDWSLLSDLCYFSYEVNPFTGQANNTYNWVSAPVVTQALARGLRVHLCVTLFSNHATFFGSATARQTLISNLIAMIQQRGAHGINIDFEAVPASQSANLTDFIIAMGTQLKIALPTAELSVALPAVDWSYVFNVSAMVPYVDFFIIMGYDYYWSGSTQAGPTDPLYAFVSSYNQNLSRSVTNYLNAGIPRHKLLLGLPYYGREWETTSDQIPASTTGAFHRSRTYRAVRDDSATYQQRGYHLPSMSSYYVYPTGNTWRQCFINSEHTLGRRYQLVLQRGLAGIGIWALGYDAGYPELWNLLRDYFTNCAVQPCQDTLYDGGGPVSNYYNNENYTYTIAPPGATGLTLQFQSFQLENGYDTLWIYDGSSINAPLLGAWTGGNSPGTVQATGGSLTLRFVSDATATWPGWVALYECSTVSSIPTDEQSRIPLIVFPNPAREIFTVRLPISENMPLQAELFDLGGRPVPVIATESYTGGTCEMSIRPSLACTPGVYVVRIRSANQAWTARVMLW